MFTANLQHFYRTFTALLQHFYNIFTALLQHFGITFTALLFAAPLQHFYNAMEEIVGEPSNKSRYRFLDGGTGST